MLTADSRFDRGPFFNFRDWWDWRKKLFMRHAVTCQTPSTASCCSCYVRHEISFSYYWQKSLCALQTNAPDAPLLCFMFEQLLKVCLLFYYIVFAVPVLTIDILRITNLKPMTGVWIKTIQQVKVLHLLKAEWCTVWLVSVSGCKSSTFSSHNWDEMHNNNLSKC